MVTALTPPPVRLGAPWPLLPPHPATGWRRPIDTVTIPSGRVLRLSGFGDAVPGGYNGGFVAADDRSGETLGRIDYQSAHGDDRVLIAWVETAPAVRGEGIADVLLARLVAEFPDHAIDPGMLTDEGARWWARVRGSVRVAGRRRGRR